MAKRQTILSQGSFFGNSSTQQTGSVPGAFGDASGLANLGSALGSAGDAAISLGIRDNQRKKALADREKANLNAEGRAEAKRQVREADALFEKSSYSARDAQAEVVVITAVESYSSEYEQAALGLNGRDQIPAGGNEVAAIAGSEAAYRIAQTRMKAINEGLPEGIDPITEEEFRATWVSQTRSILARARSDGRRTQVAKNVIDRTEADTLWVDRAPLESVTPENITAKMEEAMSTMGQKSAFQYEKAMADIMVLKTVEIMGYSRFMDADELPNKDLVMSYVDSFGDLIKGEQRSWLRSQVARLRESIIKRGSANGAEIVLDES